MFTIYFYIKSIFLRYFFRLTVKLFSAKNRLSFETTATSESMEAGFHIYDPDGDAEFLKEVGFDGMDEQTQVSLLINLVKGERKMNAILNRQLVRKTEEYNDLCDEVEELREANLKIEVGTLRTAVCKA